MLTYVECTSHFNNEYAPDGEDYYTRPEDMFEKALVYMQKHQLLDTFRFRAQAIVANATGGWGHQDTLGDHYYRFYGD
ncbi:MAG: hypothetical protein AAFY78_17395 [Cyanobacteria bacterium J06648_16]